MSVDLFSDPSVDVTSGLQTYVMKGSVGYVILQPCTFSLLAFKFSELIT